MKGRCPMSKFLVLFSTHDGQTEGIAERIGFRLSKAGHDVSVRSADVPDAASGIAEADAVIIGGPIRYGRFATPLVQLVRRNAGVLLARPTAFFSVSMSAAKDAAPAHACMAKFQAEAGWVTDDCAVFAGAIRYSRYPPFTRFMMKLI